MGVEAGGQREEQLGGGERVAERVVGPVGRQAEGRDQVREVARRVGAPVEAREQARQGVGVEDRAAQRRALAREGARRNDRSTQAWCATRTRPAIAPTSGASAPRPAGASSRSWVRRPWTTTEAPGSGRDGRTRPVTAPPATTRPASTPSAPKAMISSRRVSPLSSRSTTQKCAWRHGVPARSSAAPA